MSSRPDNLVSITRRLEDLPSDGGQAVDTLAGGLLRTFVRLNELEAALARMNRRVAVLEQPPAPIRVDDGVNGAEKRVGLPPGMASPGLGARHGEARDHHRGADPFPPGGPAPGRRTAT
jgi:hypothetical protein